MPEQPPQREGARRGILIPFAYRVQGFRGFGFVVLGSGLGPFKDVSRQSHVDMF